MKKGQFKIKALAAFMASSMVFTGTAGNLIVYAAGSGAGEASYKADNVLINSFTDGKSTSGLMARMWFPDAGAGYDGDGDGKGDYIDQVEGMITDIYEAGFGGVEITCSQTMQIITGREEMNLPVKSAGVLPPGRRFCRRHWILPTAKKKSFWWM